MTSYVSAHLSLGSSDGFDIHPSLAPRLREAVDEGLDEVGPLRIARHPERGGRWWWMFRGRFYSTAEELELDEVQALIEEREARKRQRINRAKAVAAQADLPVGPRGRAPIPSQIKIDVWVRDEGRCVVCGSNENLEYDHIIPHSMGGADSFRNLQLLCEECNRRKGATLGGEGVSEADATVGRSRENPRGRKVVRCPNCETRNRLSPSGKQHLCVQCGAEVWRGRI